MLQLPGTSNVVKLKVVISWLLFLPNSQSLKNPSLLAEILPTSKELSSSKTPLPFQSVHGKCQANTD